MYFMDWCVRARKWHTFTTFIYTKLHIFTILCCWYVCTIIYLNQNTVDRGFWYSEFWSSDRCQGICDEKKSETTVNNTITIEIISIDRLNVGNDCRIAKHLDIGSVKHFSLRKLIIIKMIFLSFVFFLLKKIQICHGMFCLKIYGNNSA